MCNFFSSVEKSRSVIPKLKKLLQSHPVDQINLHYFYDLLFTARAVSSNNSQNNFNCNAKQFNNSKEPTANLLISADDSAINKRKHSNVRHFDENDGNALHKRKKVGFSVKLLNKANQDTDMHHTVELCSQSQRSWEGNLKLVHIACHIKLEHKNVLCDFSHALIPSNRQHGDDTIRPDCSYY